MRCNLPLQLQALEKCFRTFQQIDETRFLRYVSQLCVADVMFLNVQQGSGWSATQSLDRTSRYEGSKNLYEPRKNSYYSQFFPLLGTGPIPCQLHINVKEKMQNAARPITLPRYPKSLKLQHRNFPNSICSREGVFLDFSLIHNPFSGGRK